MAAQDTTEQPTRSGHALVIAIAALAAAVTAYVVLGMPGMDHSSSSGAMTSMDHAADAEPGAFAPQTFADRLTNGPVFVVNVHVPAAASIAGTDANIAYDEIVGDNRLPADTETAILLYCRTGRMSATAGRGLLAAGYTDVSHLDGGTDAWEQAGFEFEQR